jgi:hypothetical protein
LELREEEMTKSEDEVETITKPEIQTKLRPLARTSPFVLREFIRHLVAMNAITIRKRLDEFFATRHRRNEGKPLGPVSA